MNFKFSPFLFLRTPAFSYQLDQGAVLETLLDDPYFRMAIYAASEQLYAQLEKKDFSFNKLDIKLQDSLRKYLNRMCYRPTPFGLFSSFSATSWSVIENNITLTGEEQISVEPDYQAAMALLKPLTVTLLEVATFYPNNTLYLAGNEFRYFRKMEKEANQGNDFHMLSFGKSRVCVDLFNFCKKGKKVSELTAYLLDTFESDEDARQFLDQLIEAGILVSDMLPNMTGEKYPARLANLVSEVSEDKPAFSQWLKKVNSINSRNSECFASLPLLSQFAGKAGDHPFYITHKKESSGGLNVGYQATLADMFRCADRLSGSGEPAAITSFKDGFLKKYEGREVPLLLALDPERGVGYEKLEQTVGEDELISGIPFNKEAPLQSVTWGPVQQLLLKKWTLAGMGHSAAIDISDADLKNLPETSVAVYPPSMSVVFRVINEKIVMEQAGGITANALTGRFTPYCQRTLAHNRSISAHEEAANRGIVFAEIAYVNHEHAANINTREHFREYEIPVGCHSTLPPEKQIHLSDLMVSISGNQIVLRSERLNKIVVPRHSTAYNHQRSELPVFRFLCDLQCHGVKANFTPDLTTLFPGLGYYPRVIYKGNVLSVATWIVEKGELGAVSDTADPFFAWRDFSRRRGISRFFALTSHDNQLVFDSEDRESVLFFLRVIKGKDLISLKEFMMPEPEGSLVCDHKGRAYINQFVASVYNVSRSYSPAVPPPVKKQPVQRTFLPGSEWLYLKIYSHTHTSDRILTEEIAAILKKLKKRKLISSWFFIRYYDPDHHIRLRLKVNGSEDIGMLISIVNQELKGAIKSGSVSNVLIDTYCREIERYGSAAISHVEQVFYRSSEAVLYFLSRMSDNPDLSRLHLSLVTVNDIFDAFGFAPGDSVSMLQSMYTSLLAELGGSKKSRVEMDSKYRNLGSEIDFVFNNRSFVYKATGKRCYARFARELGALNKEVPMLSGLQRSALIGDIIHMQLNRIFPTNQRKNEMVVYYLLAKYYQSCIARRTKGKLSPAA